MKLAIGFIIYDGNYTQCFSFCKQLEEHIKLQDYEIIIADNREMTKNQLLPEVDARVIDMGKNRYTLEARRAIVNVANADYIWLTDADDEIVEDITDDIWISQEVDAYVIPVEVNTSDRSKPEFFNHVVTSDIESCYVEQFGNFLWDKFFNLRKIRLIYDYLPKGDIIFCEDDITNFTFYYLMPETKLNMYYVNMPIVYKHNMNSSSITLSNSIDATKVSLALTGNNLVLFYAYSIDPIYWAYLVFRSARYTATRAAVSGHIPFISRHLDDLYNYAKKYGSLAEFKQFI